MTTILYAAYGSNLHPIRLRERIGSARLVGTANVAGFALRFDKRGRDGSGKCNLADAPTAAACLAVYEVSRAERDALDRIEGLGNGYERANFTLDGFGDCYAYLAADSHRDGRLKPFSWYKSLVLAGGRYHRFPAGYLAQIERVIDIGDPDGARHSDNARLVQRMAD